MSAVKSVLKYLKLPLWLILSAVIFNNALGFIAYGHNDALLRPIINNFLFGLTLFLIGIDVMSAGIKKSAGDKMRHILSALTKNRFVALLAGIIVTAVIQSSGATTVILIGFVKSGLMEFARTVGVILGADIGTTVTAQLVAQIVAFKLTDLAIPIIIIGFLMQYNKNSRLKNSGRTLIGFGLLFYGLKLMIDAMDPINDYHILSNVILHLENPLVGILAGTVFTALINSSSSTTSLVVIMAGHGLITLEGSIPIILGANIGSCITAAYASLSGGRDAKRVALAHVLFKITGVLMFVFWIPYFADLVRWFTSLFSGQISYQVANAHTIFNIVMALAFLPLTAKFACFIKKLLPDKEEKKIIREKWHLDRDIIQTPDFAIDLAKKKISEMAKLLEQMLRAIIIPFISDEKFIKNENLPAEEIKLLIDNIPKRDEAYPRLSLLEGIDLREEAIDLMEEELKKYLLEILRQDLSENQAREAGGMILIANNVENIADIIHRNLVPLIPKKQSLDMDFSIEGKEELMIYHHKVCKQIKRLEVAYAESKPGWAKKMIKKNKKYLELSAEFHSLHLERLRERRPESKATDEVHVELMDVLTHINMHAVNIAKTMLAIWRNEEN